ncbi:Importin 9 [Ilyodon furcidens]|uniref:Importin 9 n=1 Tax=Ilyodon furcidens TaxID=33524 RepID=A0ABV0TGP0_9TELE
MSAAGDARAGSAVGPVQQGLKEALIETLTAILSPVQEVRAAAEEQIKVLEVTEEFGVHLAELTVDPQGALAIRQLASVILKQYVETHWCAHSEKFRPPETTDQILKKLQNWMCSNCLNCKTSRIGKRDCFRD